MSLTLRQYPSVEGKKIHQMIYPDYYTTTSTLYTNSDFKYNFKLYTVDGEISNTKNPPYITNGVGVYDPNLYLKNILGNNFNPEGDLYKPCTDSIIQYRVDVEEFSSTISSPDDRSYIKVCALNSSQEDFDYTDYVLDGDGKFMTKWSTQRKVSLTGEDGMLRFLSGIMSSGSVIISKVYHFYLEVHRGSYVFQYSCDDVNPYYVETTDVGMDSDNSVIENVENYLLEFPCLPEKLNELDWSFIGTVPSGGLSDSIILKEGDVYSLQTLDVSDNITSSKIWFEIKSPCPESNPVQIQWENELGSYDFFTFKKVSTKSHKIEKTNYRKVRDSLVSDFMFHDENDRGETILHNNISTYWTINSDWLDKEEVLDLESLWYSKDIYAQIDGDFYPIVSMIDSVVINTNKRGLRQYVFSFVLSNKKYN